MRDLAVYPDTSRSAEGMRAIWQRTPWGSNTQLDGVLMVDPVFLQELTKISGNVTIPDGTVLTGDNTAEFLLNKVAYRNFCGALDWFSLSVGGVGVSRGGVEFVPVDAGPVCGRDAVVRFGRRCLFALPQGVGDE